jgi:hypothetical protein
MAPSNIGTPFPRQTSATTAPNIGTPFPRRSTSATARFARTERKGGRREVIGGPLRGLARAVFEASLFLFRLGLDDSDRRDHEHAEARILFSEPRGLDSRGITLLQHLVEIGRGLAERGFVGEQTRLQ